MLNSGIYVIISPSSKVYIGSSYRLKRRKQDHWWMMRNGKHHCIPLQNAWNKYGDHLTFVTLEHCDKDALIAREQWWIDNYHLFWNGMYNSSTKADRPTMTPEKIEVLRAANTSRVYTPESRKRISDAQKRRFAEQGVSDETRAKLSVPRGPYTPERIEKFRYPKSEEHRRKLSEAHMGKPKRKRTPEEIDTMRARLKAEWASGKRDASRAKLKLAAQRREERKKQARHMEILDWICPSTSAMPIEIAQATYP